MRTITYREAAYETMVEEMEKDPLLFLMGQDVGRYGGEFRVSGDMYYRFGDMRVKDAPISEQGIIGCALGASVTGCSVIAEIPFNDFIAMCMDQIVNQAAKFHYTFGGTMKVPIVIRTAIGGYIAAAEQHSQCLEAWFAHVPGLKVVAPSTPYDLKGLLRTAIHDPNPVIFVEHKAMYAMKGGVPDGEYFIPFGKADVKKQGKDVTVISYSYVLHKVLAAARRLEKEGISAEVVDARSLSPLDEDTILGSVAKTGRALIVHEAYVQGGLGGEIAAVIADKAFRHLKAPVKRIGAKWAPIPFTSVLENAVLPGDPEIEEAIRGLVG